MYEYVIVCEYNIACVPLCLCLHLCLCECNIAYKVWIGTVISTLDCQSVYMPMGAKHIGPLSGNTLLLFFVHGSFS